MKTRIRKVLITTLALLAAVMNSPSWAQPQYEIQKLLASNGTTGNKFGSSVALDGDTALIGEPHNTDHVGSAKRERGILT